MRDPYAPWRAPVGFIVPASGRFTRTSVATRISTERLSIVLRPSDTRVPSWGGEMLVRVDVSAPAEDGAARWGEDVAIVLDGRGEQTRALCAAALGQLGGRDRVVVVDSAGARIVVPPMPASNRSLVQAAIDRRLDAPRPAARGDRARAVEAARKALSRAAIRRVLLLTDARDPQRMATADVRRGLGAEMLPVAVVATTEAGADALEAREGEVRAFVPASGAPEFGDVVLAFEASPAPSHVLEASGGDARWEIEGGELAFGDLRAGDDRTEVVRVTIPSWTAGEPFALHVSARFDDLRHPGPRRSMQADLACTYDDDIERLAESRHGDVIAYASALATLARLDAAFLAGSGRHADDVRPIARMHARSLALLARDMHDAAAAAQAALLDALLSATD